MAVNIGVGLILVIAAVVMFALAFCFVLFGTGNTDAYPELIALGLACGVLGLKIP